jgi:flagellum-specific peptidoglycan hydrolase FlgJ
MKIIKAKKTPLQKHQVIQLFREALNDFMPEKTQPTNEMLAILLAQVHLETGGYKSMWNYNFGNAKVPKNYDGYVQMFRCSEIINGKEEWFDPPHIQTHFKAFLSAQDGLLDHLRLLANNRYFNAWISAVEGRREDFINELHKNGYFTASLKLYQSVHKKLYEMYLKEV